MRKQEGIKVCGAWWQGAARGARAAVSCVCGCVCAFVCVCVCVCVCACARSACCHPDSGTAGTPLPVCLCLTPRHAATHSARPARPAHGAPRPAAGAWRGRAAADQDVDAVRHQRQGARPAAQGRLRAAARHPGTGAWRAACGVVWCGVVWCVARGSARRVVCGPWGVAPCRARGAPGAGRRTPTHLRATPPPQTKSTLTTQHAPTRANTRQHAARRRCPSS
jgi:hypothetical protein